MAVNGKTCACCGETFPATTEYFHRRKSNGLNSYCKPCACARAMENHRQNRDRRLEQQAAYRATHREYFAEYFIQYRVNNPEKRATKDRAWRQAHLDEARSRQRLYYISHKQETMDRTRKWQAENPEKVKGHTRDKNWRRRGSPLDAEAREYLKTLDGDPCPYCGDVDSPQVVDHIRPLSKGGDSHWDNLTVSCRKCNAAKSDKSLLFFLVHRQEQARAEGWACRSNVS